MSTTRPRPTLANSHVPRTLTSKLRDLIHMRDQLLALERIAGLVNPGGTFISAEEYEPRLDLLPFPASRYLADRDRAVVFWLPARKTWRRMLWTAGFDEVREVERFKLRATAGWTVAHVVHHARR